MTRLLAVLAAGWSAATVACEGVPALVFAPPDATQGSIADAADLVRDAPAVVRDADDEAPDAISDALDVASVDAASIDASDSSVADGCPGANPPAAAYICCGSVVCEGQCTGRCDACETKCTSPGDVCCAKNNNVQCLPAGTICH